MSESNPTDDFHTPVSLANKFQDAWRRGEEPQIENFLSAPIGSDNLDLLVELLQIEFEYRIKSGDEIEIDSYLDRFPELESRKSAVLDLLLSVYELSPNEETVLNVDKMLTRFPTFREDFFARVKDRSGGPGFFKRVILRLNCPHCHAPLTIEDSNAGDDTAICATCGSSFEIDKQREVSWAPEKLPSLGKFHLIESVGRGAFGTVYRARDTELDRNVAVKIPRSGRFSTDEDEDRFVREARSVAQLGHSGIIPVYEVGRYENLPYIVSEFVEGVTLSEYLAEKRLAFRDSAQLVIEIAEALSHAHSRGVIHRDLKPSNVMLQPDSSGEDSSRTNRKPNSGEPILEFRTRLMDFGLARRDQGEITVTSEGQILGTPAYMSPEQAKGDARSVGGCSDIYSLGVIFFELLTGELPFRGQSRMLLHQVIHDEPPSLRKLNHHIPRELELICLKCLEKEPRQRYPSAGDLVDELRRFQRGEPILARPVSSIERMRRWCIRNPVVTTLSALLMLVFVTGLAGVTTQWLRAEENAKLAKLSAASAEQNAEVATSEAKRANELAAKEATLRRDADLARQEADKQAELALVQAKTAEQVAQFLIGLFRGSDPIALFGVSFGRPPSENQNPTARELLKLGTELLMTELQETPVIRATLMDTIGRVNVSLGALTEAEPLLVRALELRTEHYGADSQHPDLARSLSSLSVLRYIQGDYDETIRLLERGVAISEVSFGPAHPETATMQFMIAMTTLEGSFSKEENNRAEEVIRKLVTTLKDAPDSSPRELAFALLGKATVLRKQGKRFSAARSVAEASMVILKSPQECGEIVNAFLLGVQTNITWLSGNTELAMKQTREMIDRATKVVGKAHPATNYLKTSLAARVATVDLDQAEAMLREAAAEADLAFGPQPRTARTLLYLADVLRQQGNFDEAEQSCRDGIEILQSIVGREHRRTVRAEQLLQQIVAKDKTPPPSKK